MYQVCGCLAALLRLLGTGVWEYSSREPSEVLEAIERQTHHDGHGGGGAAAGLAPGPRAQSRRPPNEAVHKKVLEMLPMLVASAPATSVSSRVGGSENAGPCGDERSVTTFEHSADSCLASSSLAWPSFSSPSLADAALGFLSTEIAVLSAGGHAPADQGTLTRRKMALTRALLGILETCYGGGGGVAMNGGDDDPLHPEGWPWNAAAGVATAAAVDAADGGDSRWWHPSWPVHSLASWGPRLADIAGDRRSGGISGSTSSGGGALVVDRAARVVELVLRQHAGAAWREALSALRSPLGSSLGGGSVAHGDAGGREQEEEEKMAVLPLCGPLLERICLELPLMDLPVRVHAAVFAAHGWLSLLPCGMCVLRSMQGGFCCVVCFVLRAYQVCLIMSIHLPAQVRVMASHRWRLPRVMGPRKTLGIQAFQIADPCLVTRLNACGTEPLSIAFADLLLVVPPIPVPRNAAHVCVFSTTAAFSYHL